MRWYSQLDGFLHRINSRGNKVEGALINNGVTLGGEIITHALNLNNCRLIHTQEARVVAAEGPEFLQLGAPMCHDLL